MATSIARRGDKDLTKDQAQRKVLDNIAHGDTIAEACRKAGRSTETYRGWMKDEPSFKAKVFDLRAAVASTGDVKKQPVPDFETFCRVWLKQPLYPHQLRMIDVLEGRVPRDLHPSMTYEPGDNNRVLVNIPPGHAKTTSVSINYVTHRIIKDPNIKIIIVSKSQGLAKQIVGAVKQRLTSPIYRDLQKAFAPEGGWKDPDSSWTQTEIYVQGKDDGAKDPTLQCIGMGGQIYGSRADLIILDDPVTLTNVGQYETQLTWLRQEVDTRLPPDGGLLAILGTRVAAVDLYKKVREIQDIDDGQYFTYLAQPAVLDYRDSGRDSWETLWPATVDRDGNPTDMWTGPRLAKKRASVGERTWALVYQQLDVAEDAVFTSQAVEASINGMRLPGVLSADHPGHRPGGMTGLYVIGGLDPATVGCTAMMIWGVDKATKKRYVLDGFNKANTSPALLRQTVKDFTVKYNVNKWIIERNAFQRFLTQDEDLVSFLHQHGCVLQEHFTTAVKRDETFGVMGMAPLFESCGVPKEGSSTWTRTPDRALIELPNGRQNPWVEEFKAQLIVWQPDGMSQTTKTDLVMAAWFCEIGAQAYIGIGRKRVTHSENQWLSPQRRASRRVINLADMRMAKQLAESGVA